MLRDIFSEAVLFMDWMIFTLRMFSRDIVMKYFSVSSTQIVYPQRYRFESAS